MESDRPFDVPQDLHYDGARHLWIRTGEESLRVGIDSIGLESLGELAYVSLHAVGTTVARGDSIGTLEAAKMTSAILAPVGGTIVRGNDAVLRNPLLVNEDPYGDGWLFEMEATDWQREAAQLVAGEAIAGWAAAEVERFREEARNP